MIDRYKKRKENDTSSSCQTVEPTQEQDPAHRKVRPLCDTHNISVFAFGRKTFCLVTLTIDRSAARTQSLPLTSIRTLLFLSHKYKLYQEKERDDASPPSPSPASVNISFHKLTVFTVKRPSCKCYKLSSQNVQVTQLNVVCFHVLQSVSVWCVSVLCRISATVKKHMVECTKKKGWL